MKSILKIDWILLMIGALAIWITVYPYPLEFLTGGLIVLPIISILIHGMRGRPSLSVLVENFFDKKSFKSSPLGHLALAGVALGYRVFESYEPDSFSKIIISGSAATLMMAALLFATHKQANLKEGLGGISYFLIFLVLLFYSPTAMFAINCVYDYTSPNVYEVTVVDTGRRTTQSGQTYTVKVTPWGDRTEPERVEVTPELYFDSEDGDKLNIKEKPGVFHVPWFYVEK